VKPVRFSPDASCGTSNVLIENIATAALYHYTPYQPNAAALAAGDRAVSPYDSCAAYGNRNFSLYYNSWFGNPTSGPSPSAQRIAGDSRYSTAAAISRSVFSGESAVPVVYITTGEGFPDALSAGPAAAVQGGPLLLTNPVFMPEATVAELRRLKPKKIIIVGGPNTISSDVERALASLAQGFKNSPATTLKRIAGADRYETSRLIAKEAFPKASGAYIATGLNFPDALSATAAAGTKKQPVLLVNGQAPVDRATIDTIKGMGAKSVILVGGEPSVNAQIPTGLKAAGIDSRRLSGPDRWLTSVAVNKDAFGSPSGAYLATGFNFPDALAGAAAAARVGMPLYVTMPGCVSRALRDELKRPNITGITLLGGTPSLAAVIEYLPVC
jgi:putative cell wall-binding protein